MKRSSIGLWSAFAIVLIVSMVLGACAQPAPQVVEKVVTSAPQVVEKVVTQVVEKQVEKVATQVVEKQVVVTPTAGPLTAESGPVLNPSVSGNVELWHWWASPVRRNGIRRIIAMCQQKLPNIKVTDTVKPFGDVWTANVAAVAAGSGMPDVIVSDRPTLPKDAADGVYTDLDEWAKRDNVTRDQFYGWAWDQTLYNGHTYGVPFETDVRVLFWNKQAFKEAGLDPDKPPETWDDLWAYADKLDKKNADGTYARIGFFPEWNAGFNPFWAYSNGAPLINQDGTPALNDPKAVEALAWEKKWVDRYGGWQNLQNYKASYGAPPNDLFMSGAVAMLVDIFGYNSQLEFYRPQVLGPDGKSKVRMEWGIGMLPHAAGAKPANWSGGFSLSIPKGAKNAEAAWEFIKCMSSAEGQASWARDTQAQPPQVFAAKDPVVTSNPLWKIVDQALSVSTGGVTLTKYTNWGEQIQQRLEKVWTGELTPQAALDEAQKAVQDALAK